MKYLSLFSGICGGDLGLQHLLGWECIGYVEFEEYCQKVIRQRQLDGMLDKAPIFTDIREFVSSGCADLYKGITDCISGGFPCQPFSTAGKRRGEDDERNMWPATIETIRIIRPRYAFLENVPGLLASGYFNRILSDIHESGYNARWRCLSAAEVGASHKRDRLWIVADSNNRGYHGPQKQKISSIQRNRLSNFCISKNWNTELDSVFMRKNNVIPHRVDRLKAIGNGQVPAVAATAWNLLMEE